MNAYVTVYKANRQQTEASCKLHASHHTSYGPGCWLSDRLTSVLRLMAFYPAKSLKQT